MTTSTNVDFTFDALDKRFDQISFKLVTVNDRLIYARMANEFKLYKAKPGGYTPTMTSLAVTGGFSDRKPVMKTFQRLKEAGLLVQHETKPRQPLRFTVLSIDEALKNNPQLLSMPTMAERRATGLQLEKKGRKPRSVVPQTTVNPEQDALAVAPETLDCSSTDYSPVVSETTDCSSRDTHERTYKKEERSFKEDLNDEITDDIESQGQGLSRDDGSLTSKAHIVTDESDQIMSTEEEEAKPVVIEDHPAYDDDEPLDDYISDDETGLDQDDDEPLDYYDEDAAEKARAVREMFKSGANRVNPTTRQKNNARYNRTQSFRNSPNY
ncbi:hypothetical protein [Pantoea anthophila]|uniref:hypothetical protein n=1 Tax=Pantoea anthophila TaxID=470931 RepID=UPI002DBAA702|nr:hypothetical protein [Pantoea anthophila]MEB5708448.1 mitochondrial import receptor subunit TOM22 [Pantoea anthophila]MEB6519320.1 mitochondrial import receptor subunit TOM22 [Pantoea anthophila]